MKDNNKEKIYIMFVSYSYLLFRKLYPQIKREDTPITRNSVFPQPAVAVDKSLPCVGERDRARERGRERGREGEKRERERRRKM